jgi:predicted metalloprotease with PDZ domain
VRIPGLAAWGTPAFAAGLDEDDLITAADGRSVNTVDDWHAAIRAHKPGETMTVTFMRRGKPQQTTIRVGEDPTVDVVTLESTGAALTPDQQSMRQAWLGSKRK